jgi:ATP-dependent RNA helicase DBP3
LHINSTVVIHCREAKAIVPEDLMKFGTGVKKKEHGMYGAFGPSAGAAPMRAAKKVTLC